MYIIILLLILYLIKVIFYDSCASENFKLINNSIKEDITELPELLVVSSHYNEDLNWLENVNKPVIICSKKLESPNCNVEKNVGNECTAYLKFIIDNYYNLPNYVAFIHGHEFAWHQPKKLLDLIYNNAKYTEYDFISLNLFFIDDRNLGNGMFKNIYDMWDEHFKPYLNREAPIRVLHDCCAQFIVSKSRILAVPIEGYIHWYELFLEDKIWRLGYSFEYIWHVIFGEPDIVTHEENLQRFRDIDRIYSDK